MANGQQERAKWLKVARLDAMGKILDLTDPDPVPVVFDPDAEGARPPKFALNFVEYDPQTTKSSMQHRHWIDEPDLYLLAFDLLHMRKGDRTEEGRYRPLIHEYKGGSAMAAGVESLGEGGIVSRQFSVSFNDQLKIGSAYEFRFVMSEGQKGQKGQVTPLKDGRVFVDKKMYVQLGFARRFGAQVLNHLQAKRAAALVGTYHAEPLMRLFAER
jgi:hypothetical protein